MRGRQRRTSGGGSGRKAAILNATYASFPDYMDPAALLHGGRLDGDGATSTSRCSPTSTPTARKAVEVIPGLAKELPKISNGGKTYTLSLRPGLKYSDGTPVKASDFPFAVERMIQLNSGGSPFYLSIVGAEKFAETKQGPIPGIKTDDKTGEIVIDLEKPRGTFTNELGLMFVGAAAAGHADRRPLGRPAARHRPVHDHQVAAGQGLGIRAQPATGRKPTARRCPTCPKA